MYRLSPFTYLIEGILGQGVYIQLFDSKVFLLTRRLAMGRRQINCSPIELVRLNPPSGLTCGQYMDGFISKMGGYVTDPNATSACGFCSVRTTDQFLNSAFNIFYENHWRNFGIMMGYIVFNVCSSHSRIVALLDANILIIGWPCFRHDIHLPHPQGVLLSFIQEIIIDLCKSCFHDLSMLNRLRYPSLYIYLDSR